MNDPAFDECSKIQNFDVEAIRKDFPILAEKVYGKPLVYLDNGASAQKPRAVVESMVECIEKYYSNVHRGAHFLSQRSTDAFEDARSKIAKFINASSVDEVVLTRGATEAINLVASSYGAHFLNEGDEVILSTDKGKVIRCAVKEIRTAGRNTQGVRIIKLSGEEKVVSAIKIDDNFV